VAIDQSQPAADGLMRHIAGGATHRDT
jgi:hypothetical protein